MDIPIAQILIFFPLVLFSITIHEAAHAWAANRMGDPTARLMGRLTLNPLKHIDPVGTVLVPLILLFSQFPPMGWARPVPVNFRLLRDQKLGYIAVGLSGPAANIIFALFIGLVIRVLPVMFFTELLTFLFMINMIPRGLGRRPKRTTGLISSSKSLPNAMPRCATGPNGVA